MNSVENSRNTADPIGRIICFETGEEIGLLYQWDNGETQVTLYSDWDIEQTITEFEKQK
ncbi:hypothetical protein [Tritonibacter mobilis]|uniref:hypothetical protein n=1 Tax=Tritonibacter mobilis TaxID=379347 RepID=UPI001CD96C83|nr:hypothetical protein [Tritonibacter mobilis]MCA2007078.1 hypothetical protein [Tritonibacter mobilis]